jgi:hypothetical protein
MPRTKPNKTVADTITRALSDSFARVEAAHNAPRCYHVKINGIRCGSPAMHQDAFCYFHSRIHNPPLDDGFPPLEDANAVQVAIMQVLQALAKKKLEVRVAATLLYGLQTASANLKRTHFEPYPAHVITVDPIDEPFHHKPPESEPPL